MVSSLAIYLAIMTYLAFKFALTIPEAVKGIMNTKESWSKRSNSNTNTFPSDTLLLDSLNSIKYNRKENDGDSIQ
ncbi:hypothetical protein FUAX_55050 (plasmid) [Fulvitalea axinellae]|uniref:Uncharacterized protein n=1 Tax=Fulvitalea axinellae TaxID=1182444 RepID=A0AAU9DAW6_9BACT|nr:hypothetical protein FUAX_55050 [Fulvitalea axinellae]